MDVFTFDIKRVDPVIVKDNTYAYPMVYYEPSEEFIKYMSEKNYIAYSMISNSNTVYDGKVVESIIDTSGLFPNDRMEFYKKTGLWVVTLLAPWKGYFSGKINMK